MTENKYSIIQSIISGHKNFIKLVVVAILLAFGINLISSQFVALTIFSPLVTVFLGLILCIISVLYLAANIFGGLIKNHTFDAFIVYDNEKNEIIPVPRYQFSENIYEYLEAAFKENSALKIIWEKKPLSGFFPGDGTDESNQKSAQLVLEAAQYFLLNQLSTHLEDYFAEESFKKEKLIKYGRKDIPEVLLNNKFLELFSRPMDERPTFVEETFDEVEMPGEIVCAYQNGAIYEKFNLVLPNKSNLSQPTDNKIEIETEKLKISITTLFEGFSTVLPEMFIEYYLGINDPIKCHVFALKIDMQIVMKLRALSSSSGWEYYHWVDSFLNIIEDKVSKNAFFEGINWESACTIFQCQSIKQKKNESENKSNTSHIITHEHQP